MYEEIKNEFIKALADYYHIEADVNSYDFNSGCTVYGDDHEYRWLTLSNVIDALDEALENIAYNLGN